MNEFYIYILYSLSLDKYYIGSTSVHPTLRLRKHLANHRGFTNRAKDWEIVHTEAFCSKDLALKRELQIKAWKNKTKVAQLIAGSSTEKCIPTKGREGFRFES